MDCPHCTYPVSDQATQCPHCGRPALAYPNVTAASRPDEVDALTHRYEQAAAAATTMVGPSLVAELEAAVSASRAVIARPIDEALRLARSDQEAYASFYELLHAGVRLPDNGKWTRLRGLSDWELFGPARDQVRFAALSLDGLSLPTYGDVAMELAEPMIAHRATVFEENSAVYFERQRKAGNEPPVIAGSRGRWCDRGKLGVVKHAHELTPASTAADFPRLILRAGKTGADDVFIEVHIYGSMTRRTFARMTIAPTAKAKRGIVEGLRDALAAVGVAVEEG